MLVYIRIKSTGISEPFEWLSVPDSVRVPDSSLNRAAVPNDIRPAPLFTPINLKLLLGFLLSRSDLLVCLEIRRSFPQKPRLGQTFRSTQAVGVSTGQAETSDVACELR